jgi:hypothetical protein
MSDDDNPASIFYGIVVRASDLMAAGRAFAAAELTLGALDVIRTRAQRGTLRVRKKPHSALGKVPVEVWELIRQAMVDVEVLEARMELQETLICVGQEEADVECYLVSSDEDEDESDKDEYYGGYYSKARQRVAMKRHAWQKEHAWDTDWIDFTDGPDAQRECGTFRADGSMAGDSWGTWASREIESEASKEGARPVRSLG